MKTIKKSLVWFVLALVITALLPIRLYSQETQADFSIIIFPDTQVMVEKYPAVYEMMCKWVVNNRDVYNIKAVLTVGDLVEAPIDIQFKTASAGYDLIDAARIPFMPISGTHDSDFMMGSQRSLKMFDRYFGPQRFKDKEWYGGNLDGSNGNYWISFTVDARKFLIIALEFFPPRKAVAWARDIVAANPKSETIVMTHGYLDNDSTRTEATDRMGPQRFGLGPDSASGEDLWNELIKLYPNMRAVICGHQELDHFAFRKDKGDSGNEVLQLLFDYQTSARGGDGWIGILLFHPAKGTVEVGNYRTSPPGVEGLWNPSAPKFEVAWPLVD